MLCIVVCIGIQWIQMMLKNDVIKDRLKLQCAGSD